VPPLPPGDPAEGGHDDPDALGGLDDDAHLGFRRPLPPEDRIWRHPSEVGRAAPAATAAPAASSRRTAVLMLISGAVGATVAVAVMALIGGFEERVVERRVAVRSATTADADAVAALAEEASPSVAALAVRRAGVESAGSAVVLRRDGYLVTDADVIAGAEAVDVVLHGGDVMAAELVGVDPPTGVAVLRVRASSLHPAALGSSAALDEGSTAVLVAALDDGGWRASVATGVVSSTGRRVEAQDGTARYGMIVVDRPFSPGAAGGALVDRDGAVVGIASALDLGEPGGLVTPIEVAEHAATQLIDHGRVRHVWLGLHGHDQDPADATAAADAGAVVEDVAAGGPAATAGIAAGDMIVAVDGKPTPSMAALITALRLRQPGDVVVVTVWRDGAARHVDVELAARP
jgi:S1-C subfamily serine protease